MVILVPRLRGIHCNGNYFKTFFTKTLVFNKVSIQCIYSTNMLSLVNLLFVQLKNITLIFLVFNL